MLSSGRSREIGREDPKFWSGPAPEEKRMRASRKSARRMISKRSGAREVENLPEEPQVDYAIGKITEISGPEGDRS